MLIKDITTQDGPVTITESRYESGFTEIAFKVREVISGAGPILVSVVSRQGPDCKWCVCLPKGAREAYWTKKTAYRSAWGAALTRDEEIKHMRKDT